MRISDLQSINITTNSAGIQWTIANDTGLGATHVVFYWDDSMSGLGTWHPGYMQEGWYDPPVWHDGYTDYIWHEGYWENTTWHDGYWEPVWHAGYYESVYHEGHYQDVTHDAWYENVWHDGYNEEIVHEGYWEGPTWHEGYTEYVTHDGYWTQVWHDPWTETIWHEGYYDQVWHDAYSEDIWHDGWWEDTTWHEGYYDQVWHEAYTENVWHEGYMENTTWHDGYNEYINHDGWLENTLWHDGYTEEISHDGYTDEEGIWHDGYTEYVTHDGYWDQVWHDPYTETVWHEGYYDQVWHEGYNEEVWHDGYMENTTWHDGYYDQVWHEGYSESVWHDGYMENTTWHDGYNETIEHEGGYEDVWHDGYTEEVVHEGYWDEGQWIEGWTEYVPHDGYYEQVWHDGYTEQVWVDGYWDQVWHDGYSEDVWRDGYWDQVWHEGYTEEVWHDGGFGTGQWHASYWVNGYWESSGDFLAASASSDPGNGSVSVSLTNLQPGRTYSYFVKSVITASTGNVFDAANDTLDSTVTAPANGAFLQFATSNSVLGFTGAVHIVGVPTVGSVSPTSVSISWSVENGTSLPLRNTVYFAEVGSSTWSVRRASAVSDGSTGQVSVQVNGLEAGKSYAFAVRSEVNGYSGTNPGGSASSAGATTAYQFAAGSVAAAAQAISISGVYLDWCTDTAAKIDWWPTQTDPFAMGQHFLVINSNAPPASLDSAVIVQGSVSPWVGPLLPWIVSAVVTNLIPDHTYYYYVQSSLDGSFATGMNGDDWFTFHTAASSGSGNPQSAAPLIQVVVPPNTNYVTSTEAFITWEFLNLSTNINTAHFVVFSSSSAPTPANAFIAAGNGFDGFDAGAVLSSLPPGNTIYYFVQSVLDPGEGQFATGIAFAQPFPSSVLDLREGLFATSPGNGQLNSFVVNPSGDLTTVTDVPSGDLTGLNNLLATFASATSSSGTNGSSTFTDFPAGAFEFDLTSYYADARTGDTVATVQIVRTGGRVGSVTVHLATFDGSAHAGTDYDDASTTLSFADGEASKSVNIPIHQSASASAIKTIVLSLSNPSGGATLGLNSMAVVFVTGPVSDSGNATTLFGVQVPPSLSATPPGVQPSPTVGVAPEQTAGPLSSTTAAPNATLHGMCGNQAQEGPCGEDDCGKGASSPNPIKLYTANAHREIPDLEVWGGVGEHQLSWRRVHNTRYANETSYFGDAGCWRHSYQWEFVDDGNGASVTIYCPDGSYRRFWKDGETAWRSAPSVSDRLMSSGGTRILQTSNGWRYFFEPYNSSGDLRLTHFTDSQQNVYTLTYDTTTGLLSRIQEPAGRYLQITYRTAECLVDTIHFGLFHVGTGTGGGESYKIGDITLVSKVETSDGRCVNYSYDPGYGNIDDGVIFCFSSPDATYVRLAGADYGDGTAANYTYAQINGSRPLLQHAMDPRFSGEGANIRYKYYEDGPVGSLQAEINDADTRGTALISIGSYHSTTIAAVPGVHYGNGANERYEMPAGGMVAAHVDSLGRRTDYQHDQGGWGYQTGKIDPQGRVTQWTKSNHDNVLCQRHPDNSLEFWLRNDEFDSVTNHVDTLGRSTVYVRDSSNRVVETRYPDGTTEEFSYNSFGQVITHKLRNGGTESSTYDARGLKTQSSDALGHVTQYTYDSHDRVASVTDPRGNTTSFVYNSRGQVTQTTYPGNVTQSFEYDAFGNCTKVTDELGHVSRFTYDEFRRLTAVTDPLGHTTRYGYGDGGGCGSCGYQNKPTMVILPSGRIIKTDYNTEWQKVAETVGYHSADAATTRYAYDSAGNISHITDPLGHQTKFGYDLHGQRTVALDPLGNKTEWTYDSVGNKLTEKRPDGGVTHFAYNEMNQPTSITDPAGHTTQMTYLNGNLIALTDARGNTYSFAYDNLNRRTRMSYPDGSHEDYAYDAAGNLVTYTNRAGQQRTSDYDSHNRELGQVWTPASAAPVVAKSYDAAGRLTMIANQNSTITYSYDDADRLLSESQAVTGQPSAAVVHYTYDPDGNRSSMTYPDGTVVSYSYTGRNRLAAVTSGQGNVVSYQYDAADNRVSKTLGDGTTTSYGCDADSRLTSISSPVSTFAYEYNNIGNRTSKTQTDAGQQARTESYGYDATGQLTGVNYNNQHAATYNYDALGNRLSTSYDQQSISYSPNAVNQYSSVGGTGLSYDSNGNLINFNGQTFTYDAQNHLVSASSATSSAQMAYDARNRCVSRAINGVTTYFHYDGWDLIEECDASGNLVAKYIHGAKVDELLCRITPPLQGLDIPSKIYYHVDGLHSVTHLTDENGTVVERYIYDAFGQPTVLSANSQYLASSAVGNRFLFTGREWICDIGVYDYRNRAYSPTLGRFMQCDPMGFAAGDHNVYRYVKNDSMDAIDPYGYMTWNTTEDPPSRGLKELEKVYPFPGSKADRINKRSLGYTAVTWNLKTQCECIKVNTRKYFALSENSVTVEFRISVRLKTHGTYASDDEERFAITKEQDHVADLKTWAVDVGYKIADQFEKDEVSASRRLNKYLSEGDCEKQTQQALYSLLQPSLRTAYKDSIRRYDEPPLSGGRARHDYPGPGKW